MPADLTPHFTLSLEEARARMLAALGLFHPPALRAGKADVLSAIRRMGVLQIDTINVVARSPYFVLWSHLGEYDCAWLDELLTEGALFEYWAHAACLIPAEDFPWYRRVMLAGVRGWGDVREWTRSHPEVVSLVLERIRREGGLHSADFENDHRPTGGWWAWKEEKTALECLFILGELMIARRDKFQRVYDLATRVRPGLDSLPIPSLEDTWLAFTLKTVRTLGVAHASWVPDYYRLPKRGNLERLGTLVQAGELAPVEIEGLPGPAFVPALGGVAQEQFQPSGRPTLTTLLSPFDPLVWDRARARDLFGFDYTIECYTPAARRRYGYFTLPILWRGTLAGRIDAKAYRAQRLFEIRSLHLEPDFLPPQSFFADLADTLRACAAWHTAPDVRLLSVFPEVYRVPLARALAG